jgi:hypothetical protein
VHPGLQVSLRLMVSKAYIWSGVFVQGHDSAIRLAEVPVFHRIRIGKRERRYAPGCWRTVRMILVAGR